jgi:hypothetical protein
VFTQRSLLSLLLFLSLSYGTCGGGTNRNTGIGGRQACGILLSNSKSLTNLGLALYLGLLFLERAIRAGVGPGELPFVFSLAGEGTQREARREEREATGFRGTGFGVDFPGALVERLTRGGGPY